MSICRSEKATWTCPPSWPRCDDIGFERLVSVELSRESPRAHQAIPESIAYLKQQAPGHERVCFVSRRFFPAISGMSIYAINLLRQLVARGHDVTMISQYRGDEFGKGVYGGGPPPDVSGCQRDRPRTSWANRKAAISNAISKPW